MDYWKVFKKLEKKTQNIKDCMQGCCLDKRPACSNGCLFYDLAGNKKPIGLHDTMIINYRVMRHLHKVGWKLKVNNFHPLTDEIAINGHIACESGPIAGMEEPFSVTNLYDESMLKENRGMD